MDEVMKISDEELMSKIANGEYGDDLVNSLTERDKSINQMKLFLLAQAKRELGRVIKLTEFLNRVEEKYEERVNQEINNIELRDFPTIISTITACLSRSNEIIQRVIKDDTLNQLVVIDNSVNKTIGTSNSLNLDTPDSRDRVNKIVKNMLNIIDNYEEENNGD